MHSIFLEKAQTLNETNETYAVAMVVRRRVPSSGKPGDKAIITKDGQIHGWIGGGCTRGIVMKEALLAIQEGKPRFVSISPNATEGAQAHTKTYVMTCQSGGEVDIYIEPVLPKPHIVVFGTSHIGVALAKIAKAMNYQVSAINSEAYPDRFPTADQVLTFENMAEHSLGSHSYVVVCTQGEGDTEALHQAIQLNPPYLSFIASRKKANAIFRELHDEKNIDFDQLTDIKTPAGLDIGAKLPEEVAISVLAQIIQEFRQDNDNATTTEVQINNDEYYINPVCQIPVHKSTAKHVVEYKGEQVYFCCDGCKVSFEAQPEAYIT